MLNHDANRLDRKHRPCGTLRPYDPHDGISWKAGQGVWVWDSSNREYLDCISGYSANALGHAHPVVTASVQQAAMLGSLLPGNNSTVRAELEQFLSQSVLPDSVLGSGDPEQSSPPHYKTWLSTTGARGIEIAWRVSHLARPGRVVRFDCSFHGRSIGTSLLSDTARSSVVISACDSDEFRIQTIPFPGVTTIDGQLHSAESALEMAAGCFNSHGSDISCLFVEPAIGARGYYFAPAWYFQELTKLARGFGAIIVSDEVQFGLGRLGGWLASAAQGWQADLAVLGKAIGAGVVPVSAVVGDSTLLDSIPVGEESETYAAAPASCHIALAVATELRFGGHIERSTQVHELLRSRLRARFGDPTIVGWGSATAIDFGEFVRYSPALDETRVSASQLAWEFVIAARSRGVLLHLTGKCRDRIAIIPPLTISPFEGDWLADQMDRAAEDCGLV